MIDQIETLLAEAFRGDSLSLYILMLGGGFLASLTPCTYPVLPLTVGYIGNQAGASRLRAFLLSLSLVAGLGTVYAVMGAIVAAAGGSFSSIMGNGTVLFAIAMYYLIMGLFLLDVFQFTTPAFFSRLQVKSANYKGIFGAFVIGCVSGLIIGPCTGPILAVALGAIALTLTNAHGPDYVIQVIKGGALLFLFGFGQGALILIGGTFTGFILKLPRAGGWLEAIKKGSALLIILSSSLLFVMVGQNTNFPNLTRLLAGAHAPAPPESRPDDRRASQSPETKKSAETRAPDFTLPSLKGKQITLSQFQGKKGVVLVFFATWCVNCVKEVPEIKKFAERAGEENIIVIGINYKQPADIVERFIKTEQIQYEILLDEEGTMTTEKYGIRGLPHIVGIDANGVVVYRGIELPKNKTGFIEYLRQGL